jgi:hypothetical protein
VIARALAEQRAVVTMAYAVRPKRERHLPAGEFTDWELHNSKSHATITKAEASALSTFILDYFEKQDRTSSEP